MAKLDHWNELWLAEKWARVGELLSRQDPAASGLAWSHAADGYKAYYDAYQEHLPASRWDYDYGPEMSHARDRARRGPLAVAPGAKPRSRLVELALEGEFDEAVAWLKERPRTRAERAITGLLALHCGRDDRSPDAKRLAEWATEKPLGELGAAIARGISEATGEPLSHLDYPPRSKDVACVTMGIERERLWRGVGLLLERGPVRAAYVCRPPGYEAPPALRAFELEDDDPSAFVAAAAEYLKALGEREPLLDVVNVVCDWMQILCGDIEVPRGRWLPRFVEGEIAAGAFSASIELDGPAGIAWPDLVTFTRGTAGVVIRVLPAYGASGLSVEVSSTSELIATGPPLVALVRTIVDRRAIASAGQRR